MKKTLRVTSSENNETSSIKPSRKETGIKRSSGTVYDSAEEIFAEQFEDMLFLMFHREEILGDRSEASFSRENEDGSISHWKISVS